MPHLPLSALDKLSRGNEAEGRIVGRDAIVSAQ